MKAFLQNRQTATIAAIVIVTLLLCALVWFKDSGAPAPEASVPAAAKHDDRTAHQDKDDGDAGHDKHRSGEQESATETHEEEGKIVLSAAQISAAGIVIQNAASAKLQTRLQLPGEIRFNADRTAHVVPHMAGVVESVSASLGQRVRKGQVLAAINSSAMADLRSEQLSARQRLALAHTTYVREKNLWEEKISAEQDYLQAQQAWREAGIAARNADQKLRAIGSVGAAASDASLGRYEIRAPFDGIIVEKHLSQGEMVKEDANAFLITDLSTVWAEIAVGPRDLGAIRVGAPAIVKATASDATASGKISHVGALLGEQTRSAKAQIVLANPDQAWRPGLFVNIDVVTGEEQVAVAVASDAIQVVDGKNVVFIRQQDGFVAQAVSLGRSDGKLVQVTAGLAAGTAYAAAGSFALKAELGKGSAEHAH